MTDPRLRTIRFWMITASVCGGCLADHGWAVYFLATYAMAPLGMFMPVFGTAGCQCDQCSEGTGSPCSFQVDLSDIANASPGHCTNCDCLNASYTVEDLDNNVGGYCLWTEIFDPCDTACSGCSGGAGNNSHTLFLFVFSTGEVRVSVANVEGSGGNIAIDFVNNYGAGPDCTTWSAESIAHDTSYSITCAPNTRKACEGSGATCLITAL